MLDSATFLSETVTGSNSTSRIPVPKGEYPAIISEIGYRTMPRKDNPALLSHILDVTYAIDDANVREVTGLPTPTVRDSLFLDLTDENKLDMSKGKNVQLGRLREALGLNDPNVQFSFMNLKGQPCYVTIEWNPSKDGKETYANVGKVGKSPTA
jgi:hypothetical protein